MKAYVFEWPGVYLGGAAVVLAEDELSARRLLSERMEADATEVPDRRIELRTVAAAPMVCYYDNGDY